MKTNEETISRLFARRAVFYRRRNKQRAVVSVCFFVVMFLSAFILGSVFTNENTEDNPMMSELGSSIDRVSEESVGGQTVSSGENTKDYDNNATRVTINTLDTVPTRFMSRYFSTVFKSMTVDEVLSHFRLQLDIEELFEEYSLQEEKLEHGFYEKPDGTSYEQDYFTFHSEDNSKIISITLQSTNISGIYLLTDYYDDPICSYVSGKEVYIYRYQDEENEELFCEFVFRDNVGISIRMKNMGTVDMTALVEYLVNQEPVFFDAIIIP